MLLAGDIGGTNARLGLFRSGVSRPVLEHTRAYPTSAFPHVVGMLKEFCREYAIAPASLRGAAFGVAGPVLDDVVTLTNANWHIDGRATAAALGLDRVRIVNDLTAMAWGVTVLEPEERVTLHDGHADLRGNVALMAPGTGLGEALLHNHGGRLLPSPSEGGHADFAPRTAREIELLQWISARCGRTSWEHVLSGPGLLNLFGFTHDGPCRVVDGSAADAPAQITACALAGSCPACVEVLQLFVALLGSEAGNLALRTVATGGVYVGGGIPPKILPALQDGRFRDSFLAKDPARDLVARVPVHVVVHPYPGLLGAAVVAGQVLTPPGPGQ
ncbi:MAG: glucokinase [Vicinamibacterales bacterium]|nr:glucokinase [Vicinamibacterales bacterium]